MTGPGRGSAIQVGKTGDTWGWARCKLCGHQVHTDSYSGALTQIDAHLADEHPAHATRIPPPR